MQIELLNKLWFHVVSHFLSETIFVKEGVLAAKFVWAVFIIVFCQVLQQLWSHMSVIFTWSDTWEHHRSHINMTFSSNEPAWEDDSCKEHTNKCPSLLSTLDLD